MIDIRSFGAKCDGVADDAPAIQAAIRAAGAPVTSKFRGDTVQMPCGRIRCGSTLVLDRTCVLEGMGGAQSYAGTELVFDQGISPAIHVAPNSAAGSGEEAVIRSLKISAAAPTPDVETIAILVHNRCRISDVSIGSASFPFDVAVAIHGNHADTPPSNANCWVIDHLASVGQKTAIRVSGVDANAGTALAVAASGPSGSPTWLFDDDSFLGNTYIGCHASGTVKPGGGYRCGAWSANNRSVYLGCYVEGGTTNQIGVNSVVLGGTMPLDSGGYSFGSGVSNRHQVGEAWGAAKFSPYQRIFDPKRGLERYSHETTPVATANHPYEYEFRKSNVAQDGVAGWYLHHYLGAPTWSIPIMWSDGDADVGPGQTWLKNGFYFGRAANGAPKIANRNRMDSGNAPPIAGTWKRGDRVWNQLPSPGGFEGWICVASGTPGVWKGYGLIES
jgi:hypothetical protein